MALPKISHPIFELTIPSTSKTYNFRPMLVKEEKILLIAQQAENADEIVLSLKQVLNNCCVDSGLDVDKLSIADFEWLFLQLRARSINNEIELTYIDDEDRKEYKFTVDLSQVTVKTNTEASNKITNGDMTITMSYPSVGMLGQIGGLSEEELSIYLIRECIEAVYVGDEVYDLKEEKPEDVDTWIDTLETKTYESMRSFIESAPTLNHTMRYVNSNGKERVIVLESITDFFTLG